MTMMNMDGLDGVIKNIAALKDRKAVQKKALFSARKAMQLVVFAAKVGASRIDDPVTRAKIHENIVIRKGRSKDVNVVQVRVGVLGGAAVNGRSNRPALSALPGGDTTHWRMIEFGNRHQAAQPFMRPALENNTQKVTNEFAKTFSKSIENALKKGKIV